MKEFQSKWEAKEISEEIIAEGVWYYEDKIAHDAQLIKSKWNYTSKDLVILDDLLEIPFCDYIDYNISDEGYLYFWRFDSNGSTTTSSTFSTYFTARDHLNSYGTKYEINWL